MTAIELTLNSVLPAQALRARREARTFTLPSSYRHWGLIPCPLSGLEAPFARGFIGEVYTYRHDQGIVLFRYLQGSSRTLRDCRVCLRECGFHVGQMQRQQDTTAQWQSYAAWNRKNRLAVRSTIIAPESDQSWHCPATWLRQARLAPPRRSYLAITELTDMEREF